MVTQIFYEPKLIARQSAKTQFPTIKTAPDKGLTVGRQPEKKPYTPTHAREKEKFTVWGQRPLRFKLRHKAEYDFIQAVPLLFGHLENLQVVFHNLDYVEAIFETYPAPHANLFMEWVKTFAIIRKADREMLMDNVIYSTDDDFLLALRLFKFHCTIPKQKPYKTSVAIWRSIEKHFPEKPFTAGDLKDLTLFQYGNLYIYLRQWISEGKLEAVKKPGKKLLYKLKNNYLSINQKQPSHANIRQTNI